MEAIRFRGCTVVDVFQPCAIFNKLNTYQWFRENTCELPEDHDPSDRIMVMTQAFRSDKFPLGIFYRNDKRETYEDLADIGKTPLFRQTPVSDEAFSTMLDAFR